MDAYFAFAFCVSFAIGLVIGLLISRLHGKRSPLRLSPPTMWKVQGYQPIGPQSGAPKKTPRGGSCGQKR